MSIETNPYESPPVLIPLEPVPPPRPGGIRLRHLLYAVLYVAFFCWIGAMTGLVIASGFFGVVLAGVIGGAVIWGRRRSTQQDALLWAMAIAAERGMPLAPTLEVFAGQCRGRYRRKVLAAAYHLNRGSSFSDVLGYEPGLFPREIRFLLRVGSDSGTLPGALREASTLRSGFRRPWLGLTMRIIYLLWVVLVLETVVSFISYFIVPKFEAIFFDFGIPLPSLTILCIEITHGIIKFFYLVFPLFLLQLAALVVASVSILGVLPWDMPGVDRLFLRRHTALILRGLARLIEGDRPLSQGIATLARAYPTAWIRKRLEEVARDVAGGDDWCESLARRGLIRRSEAVLLESARKVGNLPWALRETAESNERRLAYRFQVLAQWLLPLCIVAIGAVVFFVVVSYFTPLIMLTQRLTS